MRVSENVEDAISDASLKLDYPNLKSEKQCEVILSFVRVCVPSNRQWKVISLCSAPT